MSSGHSLWIPTSATLAKRESKTCRVRGNDGNRGLDSRLRGNDGLFVFILRAQVLPVGAGNTPSVLVTRRQSRPLSSFRSPPSFPPPLVIPA